MRDRLPTAVREPRRRFVIFALLVLVTATGCTHEIGDPAVHVGDVYYFARLLPPFRDHGALARLTHVSGDARRVRYEFTTEPESIQPGASFAIDVQRASPRNFVPLLNDTRLRRLRAIFEGRDVWSFGTFYLICENTTPIITGHGPLHIRRIAHVSLAPATVGIGPAGYLNGENPVVDTNSPFIVFFDPPRPGIERLPGLATGATLPPRSCVDQWTFADADALDTAYSLLPLERAHPHWDAATRATIAQGRVTVGMTHAMVAWSRGFPGQIGTRAELMRASIWHYPQPAGEATVYFSGDRVTRYDAPNG